MIWVTKWLFLLILTQKMSIFLKAILDMPFIFPVKLLFPKIFSCVKFFARFSDVAIANSLAQLCKYQTPWIKFEKLIFRGGLPTEVSSPSGLSTGVHITWSRKIMADIMVASMNSIKWKMSWRKSYDFTPRVAENEVDSSDSDSDPGPETIKLYHRRKSTVTAVKARVSGHRCTVDVF